MALHQDNRHIIMLPCRRRRRDNLPPSQLHPHIPVRDVTRNRAGTGEENWQLKDEKSREDGDESGEIGVHRDADELRTLFIWC